MSNLRSSARLRRERAEVLHSIRQAWLPSVEYSETGKEARNHDWSLKDPEALAVSVQRNFTWVEKMTSCIRYNLVIAALWNAASTSPFHDLHSWQNPVWNLCRRFGCENYQRKNGIHLSHRALTISSSRLTRLFSLEEAHQERHPEFLTPGPRTSRRQSTMK
jgi:hypothetical protein